MTLYLYRVENIKTHENTYIEVFDRLEIGVVIGWKMVENCDQWKVNALVNTREI